MAEEFVTDIIAANDAKPVDVPANTPPPAEPLPAEEAPAEVDAPAEGDTPPAEEAAPTAPSVEELATQLGWNKDHVGDDKVDAVTYILRSREIQDSMRDHNKDLKSQLANLQSSVDALKKHNERVYKADVQRLQGELEALKKEKKAAVEMADVDKVAALDEQIDSVKKNLTEQPVEDIKPTGNAAYDEWIKDNQWYLTDNEMAAYADTVASQYAGAPPARIYSLVRNKVAEVFPEKFEKPSSPAKIVTPVKQAPKPVGPPSPEAPKPGGKPTAFTKANLTPDQTVIMRQFVNAGIMTEEQYINDIARMQGV